MREKLARFMAGRNGSDQLTRFISIVVCVALVLSLFMDTDVQLAIWFIAIIAAIYVYFRVFSRNVARRRQENARFLNATASVRGYFRGLRERWTQRRDYRFFRCPSCRTMLRVPRGKGKIRIVCRKCGTSFIRNT